LPYQGDTPPPVSNSAPTTPAITAGTIAKTVTVIPAVDLFLGMVTIIAKAGTGRFGHPQPQLIAQALAQAVRPTRWCEESRTLTVTVAAAGKRHGVPRQFRLNQENPPNHQDQRRQEDRPTHEDRPRQEDPA
jgi:hypothetical protein